MTTSTLPQLDEALVNALNQRFPLRSVDLEWSDREIWFRAGQRSVVEFLIAQLKIQNETEFV